MDHQNILRNLSFVPIRALGAGSFGRVFLVYDADITQQQIAVKIIMMKQLDNREWNTGSEFANMKTLSIIARQLNFSLPSYTFRALLKQILKGLSVFHAAGLVHHDIKCSNILMHCPLGSGRVHAKISDFGLANKKEDTINEQTYVVGTLLHMAPEMFKEPPNQDQSSDIYALGVAFYRLITHEYPVKPTTESQRKKMTRLKYIERPSKIKDDTFWDLLSRMLEFDPNKRIAAAKALQHHYFTSPEAIFDISLEQQDLALKAVTAELNGDKCITEFDKDPTFIVEESEIRKFIDPISYLYASLPYTITVEEKQLEDRLRDLNMTIEEIIKSLEIFKELNLLERDIVCANLCQLLKSSWNTKNKAINDGIIEIIVNSLKPLQDNEQIYPIYYKSLMIIIEETLAVDKYKIILEFILMLVKNSIVSLDDFIVFNGIRVYQQFLTSEADFQGEGNLIELRQRFEDDGPLEQLLKIFRSKTYKNEMIVNNAAIAIGYIYKAMRVPEKFGKAIIERNKVIISQPYLYIPIRALVGLGYLAEKPPTNSSKQFPLKYQWYISR
ncbi:MAG: hypothetical protein EZS28_024835 [Streblomastix strix]|uniref:Protein kinase domain-containing protein n=1 Tax=Streblomastix strix TaxID=222440 RepID=A0A5J4VAP6_9EUKA|nr:MAG: hypothetical protein EZS28_024835 [Streblomastix strix]